jgi:uncharacterized protein
MTTTVAASSKASVGKRVRRVLLTILSLYLLFVLLVMFYQRRLLYFPTQLQEKVAEQIASREELVPWRNNSGKIIGWKLPATEPATANVLIVHGNAGCALDRGYFAKPIHAAATVDVYLLEYPGYGARDGSPSQESFLAAAEEAFDLLTKKGPVFVVSESLGTGVAAHLAKTRDVAGLMFFAPFNNMVSLAQQKMPVLPIGLILWDRYNPEIWLKNYRGPIGFVLAERDEVIPSKFGQRLHDSYSGVKILQVISGAGHNEVSSQSPEWWKKVFSFWQENGKQFSDKIP